MVTINEKVYPKRRFSQTLAQTIVRVFSWKLEINLPATQKFVLIGAPHTSNWDLITALLIMYGAGLRPHWIGKDSVFIWPIKSLMRWLGGIPVNRRSSNDFVNQIVNTFNENEEMVVAITPEGTRSKADYWKSGFYYIALGAHVPIAMGFVDYKEHTLGIGPNFLPSGDIQADFFQIKEFYSTKRGKHPQKQGTIRLKDG